MDKHKLGVLFSYLTDLFDKTRILYDATSKDPEHPSPLVALYLAEIFTLKEKAKLFLAVNEELDHYEFTTLFLFSEQAYFELKSVIEKKDTNTSWMYSEFENYKAQHDIAIEMLKNVIGQGREEI